MMKIVSLNGADKAGKSTQTKWFNVGTGKVNVELTGSLSNYDHRWKEIANMSEWWFSESNVDEFLTVMFDSIRARHDAAQKSTADVVIFDRGLHMYIAVLVASLQIKSGCTYEEACDRVDEFLDKQGGINGMGEDAAFFMSHGNEEASKKVTFDRGDKSEHTSPELERYARYQTMLHKALRGRADKAEFEPIDAGRSILAIQNDLRTGIERKTGIVLPQLGKNIDSLIGLSGMSESGKSTVGDFLAKDHDFGRLKIKYFAELMARKVGNVYDLSVDDFARLFFEELNAYADAHYYIRNFSIESIHDVRLPDALKKVLGDKYRTVFCECERGLSVDRIVRDEGMALDVATAQVQTKDGLKSSKGTEQIKDLADHVINNNGTKAELRNAVAAIAKEATGKKDPVIQPRLAQVDDLHLPAEYGEVVESVCIAAEKDLGEDLALFCAAGSAGRGKAQEGWSDLDLVVVSKRPYAEMVPWVISQQAGKAIEPGILLLNEQELVSRKVIPGKWVFIADQLERGVIPALNQAGELPSHQGLSAETVIAGNFCELLKKNIYKVKKGEQVKARTIFKDVAHATQAILAVHGVKIGGFEDLPGVAALPWKNQFPRLSTADEVQAGTVTVEELADQGIALLDWWIQEQK